MKDLLIIVDVINGFLNFGALADKKIYKILPHIEKAILESKDKDYDIIAFRDAHNRDDKEFEIYPVHCLKGEPESDLIPELEKYKSLFIDIEKTATSGYTASKFREILKTRNYNNIYVTGCCTDICVIDTVTPTITYLKEHKPNTKVIVYADACYTFDGEGHPAEEKHLEALESMKNMGVEIRDIG